MRAVNSYAGFTEFDRKPAFLHPDSSKGHHENPQLQIFKSQKRHVSVCVFVSAALTKKDRSRVSAEDIRIHEDPRAAVLVRTGCETDSGLT